MHADLRSLEQNEMADMEVNDNGTLGWWKNQRVNFTYVAMAAGILCFLAYVTIWETFYGTSVKGESAGMTLSAILLHMLYHLVIWIPFLAMEIYAFRILPLLDQRINPKGRLDLRKQIVVVGCVAVCLLPLVVPAILILWHG